LHAVAQTDVRPHPRIEINSASIDALRTALGISREEAEQIVAHRPYQSGEQFRARSGLKPAEVDRLAPLITVMPGPIRAPRLPPGAVPISPEEFMKGRSPGRASGPPLPPPGAIPVPVPPGMVQKVPVPPGTFKTDLPVPRRDGQPAAGTRDLRRAFAYGLLSVVVVIAAIIYMWRTSPKRRTGHS
jgi:hypothetical protein